MENKKFNKWDAKKTILKGAISFLLGIAGLLYIKYYPNDFKKI